MEGGLGRESQRIKLWTQHLISDALLHSERTLAGVGLGDMCECGGGVWRSEDI